MMFLFENRLGKIIVAFMFLTVFLAHASGSGNAESLRIAIPTDPDTFNTHQTVAAATAEIAFNIYEGLVKATPDGSIKGALATHWDVDESQRVYTFYLREAYFHNGERVTAQDVVSALDKARDPEISKSKAAEYAIIEEITSTGDQIVITLSEPYSPFIYSLVDIAAAIYPRNAQNLHNHPMGTGPYKFAEWLPNQHIKLQRFEEHYAANHPFFDEVVFRIMPDENSAVLSLRTGHIDLIPRLEPSFLHQVEGSPHIAVHSSPMNLVQVLAINNARPPFDDPKVRQALVMAVDREEVILGAAWGHGDPLFSGVSPAMGEFFNSRLGEENTFDPEQARLLLKDAGYENLTLTLSLPAPYALHVQAGEIVAQQWERIGIKVQLQIVEWGTWLERVYTQRDYDVSIIGLTGRIDPHPILVRYTSDSSRNFFNFANPDYDQLIKAGVVANAEDRRAIYQKAQEVLARQAAGVFLMDPSQLAVMSNQIKGWQSYPIYVIDLASLYK